MNSINKYLVIALIIIVIVSLMKTLSLDSVENNEWSDGTYNQCIISEPNEIIRVKVQEYLGSYDKHQDTFMATFYDFNNKAYPAKIDIDFMSGVSFFVDLGNDENAFLNIDYANHKCSLDIDNFSSVGLNVRYHKEGYLGSSIDYNDLDDFQYKLAKAKHIVHKS